MSIKIQINSLQALERLIGNDNELEIELRASIVQEFTKRHLKDLAKTELINSLAIAVKNEVKAEFFEEIKMGSWGSTTTVFKKEQLEKVRADLAIQARHELGEIVSEVLEEQKTYDKIKEKLNHTSDWMIEQLAPERIESRLEKMVDQKLKEKLGLK